MTAKKKSTITARCVFCKKKKTFDYDAPEIKAAQEEGVLMCECFNPMVVIKAEARQ